MKTYEKLSLWLLAATVVIMLILVGVILTEVSETQYTAMVLNKTGIVRGASQRLIKQEFYGVPNDGEIDRIDEIIKSLDGRGQAVYNDPEYAAKQYTVAESWESLKNIIFSARKNTNLKHQLYSQSEVFYNDADALANATENFAKKTAKRLESHEFSICISIAVIIFLFVSMLLRRLYQNKKLKDIAYIDANTGLPNKRRCEELLNEPNGISEDATTCCMMFDLNNLKKVNDTLGHNAGDVLIFTFASILKRSAYKDMFIGRYGGDEFIGVAKSTSKLAIESFINRLKFDVEKANIENSVNGWQISFAYGCSFSDDYKNITLKGLMDEADSKMYHNKAEMKTHSLSSEKK